MGDAVNISALEPARPTSDVEDVDRGVADLERTGTLRRGVGRLLAEWPTRRVQVDADLVAAVASEREEGR